MADLSLSDRFVRLCEIASPTGFERGAADAVIAECEVLDVEIFEDGAAVAARAGSGNLIARVPGTGDGWVAFFAHLDTVPHDGPIEVEFVDGSFRSRGETILGADNKAAVAVLLELAARRSALPGRVGLELVFTVAEEEGLRGAKELDLDSLRSRYGYVLDHATPIGEIITAAPTLQQLTGEFDGTEAHAGMRPEAGHSAISAAAAAVAAMQLGRLDEESTANVGVISGGTASNVVPGRCRIEAEARSRDDRKVAAVISGMVDGCTWAASESGCDCDIEVSEVFRGYRIAPGSAPLQLARAALERCRITPQEVATGGGSDANALITRGFEAVLLANGTLDNHTSNESVAADRLDEMVAVCEAIVDLAE